LPPDREVSTGEFMREAKFVSGLQQTRSQGAMDLYRAIKDLAADRLKLWS